MKTSSKFFVIGAFVSVLGILTISSTGFISEVFANNMSDERMVTIQYKILSLTYSTIQFNQPSYLRNLLTVQNKINTRSSSSVTLIRPSNPSNLMITN